MRTIPASIINAFKSPDLPITREVLLYRRTWNAGTGKYILDTTPVDITEWVTSYGKVKIKLDVTEIDKWETSNLTLSFSNDFNRFKEGRAGGLFENSVIYGSKIVYRMRPKDTSISDTVTVFTGFLYTAPNYRDNGNTVDFTITSDLKALEYISAEALCETSTDIECNAVADTENKTYSTPETGIGFIDTVKYGADLATSQTLIVGTDYEVDNLNKYEEGAKITLKLTPVSGHKLYASYRYWYKDMTIDSVVLMLLEHAGITENEVSRPTYPNADAKVYEENIYNNAILWCTEKTNNNDIDTLKSIDLGGFGIVAAWNKKELFANGSFIFTNQTPVKGLHFVMDYTDGWFFSANKDFTAYLKFYNVAGGGEHYLFYKNIDGVETQLYVGSARSLVGFSIDENNKFWVYHLSDSIVTRTNIGDNPLSFNSFCYQKIVNENLKDTNTESYYRQDIPSDITNTGAADFISRYLQDGAQTFGVKPCARFDFHNTSEYFKQWGAFSCDIRQSGSGVVKFYWSDSDDGATYGAMTEIAEGESIGSTKPYLRFYVRTESAYPDFCYVDRLKIWSLAEGAAVPLVNFTDLSVSEAIQALAKLVAFEIGLNQDGVFFFRPRAGTSTDVELTDADISDLPRAYEDIDSLYNKISVKFGNYQTTVSDTTENADSPTSMDKYGERVKEVQSDNFIPADNVDISRAVGLLNYAAFKGITRRFDVEAKLNAALELGDIITLSLNNINFCDPADNNRRKSAALTAWGVSCRILGIELDLDKRLMTLDLKEVINDYKDALLFGANKVMLANASNYIKYK